jgi:SAM-dependent methyltransferase
MMDQYTRANRILWNAWTKIHEKSQFYDIQAFKAGGNSLKVIELDELGDVRDRSLLHLQCHFGQDTLSWARLGAQVTGVDFSDEAISLARSLAGEIGLKARFICSDLYELPQVLEGQFDIVFTSYGVLAWLSDLPGWAAIIAHYLKPGGIFYIVEIHPYADTLDDWDEEPRLGIRYPYFQQDEPVMFEAETSYAEPDARHTEPIPNYQWNHSLGEVLNALLDVGLQIRFLHEFPMTVFKQLAFMVEREGWWYLPEGLPEIPLLFSMKAIKPA